MTRDLELSQSFTSHGWIIKYGVFGENTEHTLGTYGTQTIVFVHGTPWYSAVFKPLARALLSRGGYRVVLYDLAGYGQSQEYCEKEVEIKDNLFKGGKMAMSI